MGQHPLKKTQKLPYIETEIAQPPKQVQRSPRWPIKDKGHTYILVKRFFLILSLVKALGRVEVWGKIAIKKTNNQRFSFWEKHN